MGRDAGSAPLELVLGVGLLLLPLACVVLALPVWVERQSAARVVAQEAARAAVLAADGDAVRAASGVAGRVAGAHGLGPDDVVVQVRTDPPRGGEAGGGIAAVVADVEVRMPALVVPGLGTFGAWTWTTAHRELVDPYRGTPQS